MEKVSLVKIAKINMGQSPLSESYNKVGDGLPFFQGKTDFGDVYPKVRIFCTSPNKIAEADDILLSVRAPVGSINICKTKSCIGRGLAAIRAKSEIEQKYLYHFLNYYEPQLAQIGKGSTFEAVNREDVENIEVPLPNPDEQKRIAAILDKADRLRRQRRFAQTLSDSFLQSVFIKMFGNPLFNPKGFDVKKVGTQIKNIRYGTGSPPEYQDKGVPFVRATNVKGGTIQPKDMAFISEADAKKIPKCEVKEGDMIVVRSGVNTGDCALIPKTYNGAYAAYDLIVEIDYPTNHFYNSLINSDEGKAVILPLTRRAGQPHLNAEQVSDLEFPLPPLPLQEKFAEIVQKFERVRRQQREATRQAEHLFQTLLHRAFRGEL